ncbi:fibronectin type III domain-containing protein [Flavobacterium sp. C3NV]|uniref:fibronectin type III domain-containing protein n=1 Tax=Flavobacterium sp. C3NV TaxID=3393358 RepID=UPI00398F9E7E
MKQVNFTHPGGFPLEQETLERLQTAYRSELFGALKSHLGIEPGKNYIIAHATKTATGWAIIHQDGEIEGILYSIKKEDNTGYLKTTRTGTNLTYGNGESQTAYFDYEAQYISDTDYANRPASPPITDALAVHYYDLSNPVFIVIKDIQEIERIIQIIEANINSIKTDISSNYLPLKGSKAMEGDLNLGSYQLSKLDISESGFATVRAADFRLGSIDRKGKLNPADPTGRALVDSSDETTTSLSLNYKSDWTNTNIGGKVYLNNISSSNSTGSLLVVDSSNQVIKSNTLIESLIKRITDLEEKPATAVPKGMIALWGKPAPFPEGWEEYVPLRGRMPVGLNIFDSEFSTLGDQGGNKNKKLTIDEIPTISPINGTVLKKGGTWGGNSGLTIGDYGNSDYAEGELIKPFGGDMPFSILNPYRVVHFIEYTGRSLATTALTTPPNLRAEKVGATFVDLSWTPTYNDVGITNYLVYKNDILFATTNNARLFTVNGLSRVSSYNFHVIARDAAGNLSAPSNVVRERTNLF